jgi:hypothetical protein
MRREGWLIYAQIYKSRNSGNFLNGHPCRLRVNAAVDTMRAAENCPTAHIA